MRAAWWGTRTCFCSACLERKPGRERERRRGYEAWLEFCRVHFTGREWSWYYQVADKAMMPRDSL